MRERQVGSPTGALDSRWERSARFWLRAYPRRWRAAWGEELLGVLADLAEPGARRLGMSATLDLVRAGWLTRVRTRPPFWRWAMYRGFDQRLPVQDRAWVRDDIDGRTFPLRRDLAGVLPLLVVIALTLGEASDPGLLRWLLMALAVLLLLGVTLAARTRDDARRRHLVVAAGEQLVHGLYLLRDRPRRRLSARWALPRVALGWAVAGVLGSAAMVVGPTIPHEGGPGTGAIVAGDVGGARPFLIGAAILAAVGGLVLAVRVRRSLRGRTFVLPVQPDRELVDGSWRHRLVLVSLLAAVALTAGSEASGRTVLLLTPWLAVLGLGLAPATVVATFGPWERADEPGPALSDVWAVAVRQRPPRVDEPGSELVAVAGPVPDGAVARARPWREPPYPALPA